MMDWVGEGRGGGGGGRGVDSHACAIWVRAAGKGWVSWRLVSDWVRSSGSFDLE